jgi:class 3 adenylate cyclase
LSSPDAWIVVGPGTPDERLVPINGRLLVGRECADADPGSCLILADPAVSRDHLEIRAGAASQPTIVDMSTNGTRVNGRRIERGQPIPLSDQDRIELGASELRFRAGVPDEPEEPDEPIPSELESAIRESGSTVLAIAVGDVVGYAGLLERHGAVVVAEATETLFASVGELLLSHKRTISNFADDAIFAAWDALRDPDAPKRAVEFAFAANELVFAHPAAAAIPDAKGTPLRIGWAVTLGEAGVGRPSAGHPALQGDAVTLAFRVASIAGRGGRGPVLVSARAAAAAPRAATYGDLEEIQPKGYSSVTWVRTATRQGP